jgi:hypothetical protein
VSTVRAATTGSRKESQRQDYDLSQFLVPTRLAIGGLHSGSSLLVTGAALETEVQTVRGEGDNGPSPCWGRADRRTAKRKKKKKGKKETHIFKEMVFFRSGISVLWTAILVTLIRRGADDALGTKYAGEGQAKPTTNNTGLTV